MSDAINLYGWTAKARDPKIFLKEKASTDPRVLEYAELELNTSTLNHSMRVFYYGKTIHIQQFPEWEFSDEAYLLAYLLHDIGTTDKNIEATNMSFEFYGGLFARDLLHNEYHAPIEQAESVAECIIRHQDIADAGTIHTLGLLIQLATIFGGWSHSEGF
ncbi:hypothetical protein MMC22_011033 [Lobaria immixta]|nr:hypothetical protein [Lobaria immixta]